LEESVLPDVDEDIANQIMIMSLFPKYEAK